MNNNEVCDTSLWNDFIDGDKPSIFSYRRNENRLSLYPDTIDCIETAINISKEIANDISTLYIEIDNIAIEYNDKLVERKLFEKLDNDTIYRTIGHITAPKELIDKYLSKTKLSIIDVEMS